MRKRKRESRGSQSGLARLKPSQRLRATQDCYERQSHAHRHELRGGREKLAKAEKERDTRLEKKRKKSTISLHRYSPSADPARSIVLFSQCPSTPVASQSVELGREPVLLALLVPLGNLRVHDIVVSSNSNRAAARATRSDRSRCSTRKLTYPLVCFPSQVGAEARAQRLSASSRSLCLSSSFEDSGRAKARKRRSRTHSGRASGKCARTAFTQGSSAATRRIAGQVEAGNAQSCKRGSPRPLR